MKKGTNFNDISYESGVFLEPEFDEDGYLKANKKVVDHLLRHNVSVETGRRELDSSIIDYELLSFNSEEISRLKKRFTRNYGIFSDGQIMRIPETEEYFKFTSNIVVSMDSGIKKVNDDQKLFSLISLYERAINQLPTITVFLNGKKIPDEFIYVYMTDSCTDILIPDYYLPANEDGTFNPADIFIQKHVHKINQYYSLYKPNVPNKLITIELDKNKRYNLDIKYRENEGVPTNEIESCKNIILYINGLYRDQSAYGIAKEDNIIKLTLGQSINTSDAIEVIIDSDIQMINTVSFDVDTIQSVVKCYFNLNETTEDYKINYLYGAIPKKNCYFYVNNERIPNNKINQVGRMNFMCNYTGAPAPSYNCTIIYTDREFINESDRYIYGEDYYLSNMSSVGVVSKLIKDVVDGKNINIETEDYINKFLFNKENNLDIMDIMTKGGQRYTFDYTNKINTITKKYSNFESQVRDLIKESGNYMVRDFLNLYSKNDIYDLVTVDKNSPDYFSYTFRTRKDEIEKTNKFYYLVDINGVHVKDTDFTVVDMHQYNHINLPKELFNEGDNKLHIRECKFDSGTDTSMEYKVVRPSDVVYLDKPIDVPNEMYRKLIRELYKQIEEIKKDKNLTDDERVEAILECETIIKTHEAAIISNYRYSYTFDKLVTPTDVADYVYLKSINKVPGYFYYDETEKGWIINRETAFIINDNKTVTLLMEEMPEDVFIIYSRQFSFKFTYTVPRDLVSLSDMSIGIRGDDNYGLPIIPTGSYTVFLNGDRLYNGIDYVFRHPGNYDLIAYTSLSLKRKSKEGDVVTIYFDNIRNITVGHSSDVLSFTGSLWNKFGLIYFGGIKFPYSPKYIDLYVNGKYIYPNQIEIISDKLIRIEPDIKNPMFDIFAETSFNVDINKLKFFYDYDYNPYKDSEFEKMLARLFVDYNFSTITNPSENSSANNVYESFDEDVDSWKRVPNVRRHEDSDEAMKEADSLVPYRYNLYESAYLIWLKSNSVKSIFTPGINISDDVVKYFKFYVEENSLGDRQDLVVSPAATKIFNDLQFDAAKYPFENADRVRRYSKFGKANNLPTAVFKNETYEVEGEDGEIITKTKLVIDESQKANRNIFNELRDHFPISNAMYPRDFPKILSSKSKISQKNRDLLIGGRPGPIYNNTTTHKPTEE
ncbi:MAG: hypothetical protein ACRC5M_04320 [Anaeroplasmataceae bacterium]